MTKRALFPIMAVLATGPTVAMAQTSSTLGPRPTQTENLPRPGTSITDAVSAARSSSACKSQEFKVYYNPEAEDFTDIGYSVARQALNNARANPECRIGPVQVHGFSDTYGSAAENTAQSKKFAELIRDYLMGEGVSGFTIDTRAYGEAYPAVATGDDVKEPLNRRVEVKITLQPAKR